MTNLTETLSTFANAELGTVQPLTPLGTAAPTQLCTPTTIVTVAAIAYSASTWTAFGGKVAAPPVDLRDVEPDACVEELLGLDDSACLMRPASADLVAA